MNRQRKAWILSRLLFLGWVIGLGCHAPTSKPVATHVDVKAHGGESESCPLLRKARGDFGIDALYLKWETWASYWSSPLWEEVLMDVDRMAGLNQSVGRPLWKSCRDPEVEQWLKQSLEERLNYLKERLKDGRYVNQRGEKFRDLRAFESAQMSGCRGEVRIALETIPVRCGPKKEGFYTHERGQVELRYDRNNCSAIHEQEPFEILAKTGGLYWIRTPYTLGWIDTQALMSPPLRDQDIQWWLKQESKWVNEGHGKVIDARGVEVELPQDVIVPREGEKGIYFATREGIERAKIVEDGSWVAIPRPLTRRDFYKEVLKHVGEPYGWGGEGGHRDCSRLVMDVFDRFGIRLKRFSGDQANSGNFWIDLTRVNRVKDRLLLIQEAAQRGIVLLYFPGHVMIYLGKDSEGRPLVIHSLGSFLEPCAQHSAKNLSGETEVDVSRIVVTSLDLGEGSSKKSLLERVTRVVVFGRGPGVGLEGVAEEREAAIPVLPDPQACDSLKGTRIFISPAVPNVDQRLRVMAVSERDLSPMKLVLYDPKGKLYALENQRYGGPPFSWVIDWKHQGLVKGKWTAVLGDGSKVQGCHRFKVRSKPYPRVQEKDHVWTPRRAWDKEMDNFFALFMESLFTYPLEGDPTWKNLHTLLRNPDRNLLYNHLSLEEEEGLKMRPDCADLPYYLRAYFAWKMKLPFGFRRCNRGRAYRAPTCEAEPTTSLIKPAYPNDVVKSFGRFVNGKVRNTVHSGTGRTAPDDDQTDYYPVPLNRESIKPGTLYADPYGHLLIVARWIPQGLDQYGILIAADAQPDGTVGLKRFWRGTFLFTPDTKVAGAGFKAFRPLLYRGGSMVVLTNEEILKHSDQYVPFSKDQYEGSEDDFYDRMDALINPRPLDPYGMQKWLIDAFEEAIQFRIVSVNNGEKYRSTHGVIPMPEGKAIFQTVGPWEDFSTPSRDMRILIALYTVIQFPEKVRRYPERYGLQPGPDLDREIQALKAYLDRELASRTFEYQRSNGQIQQLSLKEIVKRRKALEMAYNPNDCIEIRWGAPRDSEELSSCRRRAPKDQIEKMKKYRKWFAERKRPIE